MGGIADDCRQPPAVPPTQVDAPAPGNDLPKIPRPQAGEKVTV